MPILNRGPGPFPHIALEAKRHRRLADDLDRIARGDHPSEADLLEAPRLFDWSVEMMPSPHLVGRVSGHPTVKNGRPCCTSQVITFDPVAGYARTLSRCFIPGFDGAVFSREWRESLWVRFTTGAPRRQRRSVERYSIVKRA